MCIRDSRYTKYLSLYFEIELQTTVKDSEDFAKIVKDIKMDTMIRFDVVNFFARIFVKLMLDSVKKRLEGDSSLSGNPIVIAIVSSNDFWNYCTRVVLESVQYTCSIKINTVLFSASGSSLSPSLANIFVRREIV